jgi:ubiquinone/menaquinone biosynthesis C-methylase UbiE
VVNVGSGVASVKKLVRNLTKSHAKAGGTSAANANGTASSATSVSSVSSVSSPPSLTRRKREVPADFDIVAGTYDKLVMRNPGYLDHLALSAKRLDLPSSGEGLRILDLCCGTGLSTAPILSIYPTATVVGLDASAGMLDLARSKPANQHAGVTFVLGDAMNAGPALAAALASGDEPGEHVEHVERGERGERGATASGAHPDVQFDAILMAYGIRNMPDADACLQSIRTLLKPGAPICFHEYSVADSPRAKGTWTFVAWGIIIPSGLITSRHTRIYRYLWKSVMDFDGKRAFEDRLRRAGFTDVRTEPMDGWQKDIVHSFLARAPKDA